MADQPGAADDSTPRDTHPSGVAPLREYAMHRVPALMALDSQLVSVEANAITLHLDWREDLVGNPESGALMGGVITTLMDHASGLAVGAALQGKRLPEATLELRIDLHRDRRDEADRAQSRDAGHAEPPGAARAEPGRNHHDQRSQDEAIAQKERDASDRKDREQLLAIFNVHRFLPRTREYGVPRE